MVAVGDGGGWSMTGEGTAVSVGGGGWLSRFVSCFFLAAIFFASGVIV